MMNRYEILKAISRGEPAALQSIYEELEEDRDGGSLIEELDSLVSEGLIEERREDAGVTYVLTALGKKKLEALDR